jgi:hypothetical protein
MPDTMTPPSSAGQPHPGLLSRVVGVLFSPRETFAAVAARPKWFGALSVAILIMGVAQYALLSTEVGQQLALDQQIATVETFGGTISDEQYARMEDSMANARYISPIATIFFVPVMMLATSGILHVLFGLVGGGNGTFKQVYAISAHAAIISSLQVVFTTIVTLAAGRPAGANLSVFAPMLEETSFANRFLSTIDLFYVWSTFITAVGLGVLYKRRTSGYAMVLFGIYLVIAALIAFIRSGS